MIPDRLPIWSALAAIVALAPAPARADAPTPHTKATLEAGGLAAQGLDATNAGLREGGGYAGAAYWLGGVAPIFARYSAAEGQVVDRIARPGGGPAQDVAQSVLRHTAELGIGYRLDFTKTTVRPWIMPFLGPRALFLVDDVAPLWAFELGGGGRLGVTVRDAFELSALVAFDGAVARTDAPRTVYGAPKSELRFGGDLAVWPGGPFALTLAYEGNVVALDHEKMTFHQALAGVLVRFQ